MVMNSFFIIIRSEKAIPVVKRGRKVMGLL